MKSECDIRVLRANLEAELGNHLRGDNHSLTDCMTESILRAKIELLKDILETEDNQCY